MAKFALLLVTLDQLLVGMFADSSFRHVASVPDAVGTTNVEDNSIHDNEIHDFKLSSTEFHLLDLKKLVQQQTSLIQHLIKNQDKLSRENSKWLKRYKSTRRYLRRLNRSCMCRNQKSVNPIRSKFKHSDDSFQRKSNLDISIDSLPTSELFSAEEALLSLDVLKQREKLQLINNIHDNMKTHLRSEIGDNKPRFQQSTEIITRPKATNFDIKPESSKTEKYDDTNAINPNFQHGYDDPYLEILPQKRYMNNGGNVPSTDDHTSASSGIKSQSIARDMESDKSEKSTEKSARPAILSPEDKSVFYDFEVDLTTGDYHGDHSAITWETNLSIGETVKCGLQGVVKISFPRVTEDNVQDTLMIDMWFSTPTAWVFNIGDSRYNDGLSGDGSSQENDCEADGYGTIFTVHGSDKSENPLHKILFTADDFLKHNASFLVANEAISWRTEIGEYETLIDPSLFALKSQSDSQGTVNYDVYVGMNRVIAGNYRTGTGLCRVAFKWIKLE